MSYQDMSRADRKRWRRDYAPRCYLGRPLGVALHPPRLLWNDEPVVTFVRRSRAGAKMYTLLSEATW